MSIVYLDDMLFIRRNFEDCEKSILESKYFLENLGCIVDKEKSNLSLSQIYKFLDFVISSQI